MLPLILLWFRNDEDTNLTKMTEKPAKYDRKRASLERTAIFD